MGQTRAIASTAPISCAASYTSVTIALSTTPTPARPCVSALSACVTEQATVAMAWMSGTATTGGTGRAGAIAGLPAFAKEQGSDVELM